MPSYGCKYLSITGITYSTSTVKEPSCSIPRNMSIRRNGVVNIYQGRAQDDHGASTIGIVKYFMELGNCERAAIGHPLRISPIRVYLRVPASRVCVSLAQRLFASLSHARSFSLARKLAARLCSGNSLIVHTDLLIVQAINLTSPGATFGITFATST